MADTIWWAAWRTCHWHLFPWPSAPQPLPHRLAGQPRRAAQSPAQAGRAPSLPGARTGHCRAYAPAPRCATIAPFHEWLQGCNLTDGHMHGQCSQVTVQAAMHAPVARWQGRKPHSRPCTPPSACCACRSCASMLCRSRPFAPTVPLLASTAALNMPQACQGSSAHALPLQQR